MVKIKIHGWGKVVGNLNRKQSQMEMGTFNWVKRNVDDLFDGVKTNIVRDWHSLKVLAAMDHPYARRHLQNPHSPYYMIHEQSGDLKKELKQEFCTETGFMGGAVGFTPESENELRAPGSDHSYLRCVIFGTEHMVSRDFLSGTLLREFGIKKTQEDCIKTLSKVVRRKV